MDEIFNRVMQKTLEQATEQLYQQVDAMRQAGHAEAPCRKCHTPTALSDLRPKVLADMDIRSIPMTIDPNKVELGLCCPECVSEY